MLQTTSNNSSSKVRLQHVRPLDIKAYLDLSKLSNSQSG